MSLKTTALWLGGLSTAAAVLLSAGLIAQHLLHFTQPRRQLYIILIVLMVPIFAVDSFVFLLKLGMPAWAELTLDAVKECYEAVAISSFLRLMYEYLGCGPPNYNVPKQVEGKLLHHSFPFSLLFHEMPVNRRTLRRLLIWTRQFILIRPVLSVATVVLARNGALDEYKGKIMAVLNVSVTLAVYALVLFYHAFAQELKDHRPLAQFLCIKGVVFFAFWQGVILKILEGVGVVHAGHWHSVEEVAAGIQALLVCVEAGLIFAPAHHYAYTAAPYIKEKKEKRS